MDANYAAGVALGTSLVPLAVLLLEFRGLYDLSPYANVAPVAGVLMAIVSTRGGHHHSRAWLIPPLIVAIVNCAAAFALVLDPDPYFTQGPSDLRHSIEWFAWLLTPVLLPLTTAGCLFLGPIRRKEPVTDPR